VLDVHTFPLTLPAHTSVPCIAVQSLTNPTPLAPCPTTPAWSSLQLQPGVVMSVKLTRAGPSLAVDAVKGPFLDHTVNLVDFMVDLLPGVRSPGDLARELQRDDRARRAVDRALARRKVGLNCQQRLRCGCWVGGGGGWWVACVGCSWRVDQVCAHKGADGRPNSNTHFLVTRQHGNS
jgi:hypothetical protein